MIPRTRLTALAALLAGAAARAADQAAAAADDIRDIRGPKPIFPWVLALAIAAAALVLIVLGLWLWRRLTRRAPPVLTPADIALQRIEAARQLMAPTTVREFSTAISDVVRAYIEAQFDVTATHLTTEEFLHDLLGSERPGLLAHRDLLGNFLENCDMAKFAKASLSAAIMEDLYQSAREFVITTSTRARTDSRDAPSAGATHALAAGERAAPRFGEPLSRAPSSGAAPSTAAPPSPLAPSPHSPSSTPRAAPAQSPSPAPSQPPTSPSPAPSQPPASPSPDDRWAPPRS